MIFIDLYFTTNGQKTVSIPKGYKFVTIMNPTPYGIQLFKKNSTELLDRFGFVPVFTHSTIPLPESGVVDTSITVTWAGSGPDKAALIVSQESLGINQTLINPDSGDAVSIIADSVGLARQNQLPENLTAGGNMKVAVMEGDLQLGELPAGTNVIGKVGFDGSIPAGANVIGKVGFDGSIPAGNNNIGNVDIESLPVVNGISTVSSASRLTVLTSAIAVTIPDGKASILLKNIHESETIYLGKIDVNTSTGFPLLPGETLSLDKVGTLDTLYAITANTGTLAILGFTIL